MTMKIPRLFASLVVVLLSAFRAEGFVARPLQRNVAFRRLPSPIVLSSDASDDDTSTAPWVLPNDFEMFLNQCTIQSFLFLLKSLRDPQTILWIEDFTDPAIRKQEKPKNAFTSGGSADSRLLNYHGLAAMNTTIFPTWNSYFSQLLDQPIETHTIESNSKYVPDYELEIKPASLCSRMISVREQIAREWVRDLDVISYMGGQTLESYWEALKKRRDSDGEGDANIERENLSFLEYSPDPDSDYAPSPLRKGNFDLLTLQTTQEAIHRVLNDPDRKKGAEKMSNKYLRDFYGSRMLSHFSGAQRYGRADDFLEELLSSTPTLQVSDESTAIIDPIRIAELVVKERENVALEWKEICQEVPEHHMEIKRMQLNLLMGIPASGMPEESKEEEDLTERE